MSLTELKPIKLKKSIASTVPEMRNRDDVNMSGIRPTEFNILIRPDKVEDSIKVKRPDGTVVELYKPNTTVDREQAAAVKGTMIAVSPLAFTYERWPEGSVKPVAGDRVAYQKYAGMKITGKDGVDYILAKDKDVACTLDW